MIYIYDILLNWSKGAMINEFYEWSLDDDLEHIKKIPLVKVSDMTIKDMLTSLVKVDKEFLGKIKNKTQSYFHNDIDIIDYAVIVSNGKRALALELDGDGLILYKSLMLLDEEEEVLTDTLELTLTDIKYEVIKRYCDNNYLTRYERGVYNYLEKEVKKLNVKRDGAKINYLYSEFFVDDSLDIKTKFLFLLKELDKEYGSFHEKLYQLLKLSNSKLKS